MEKLPVNNGIYAFESKDFISESYDQVELMQVDTITVQDTIKAEADSVPPKPTFEQIRYWRWLREKRMLIDGSRYIKQQDNVKLIASKKLDDKHLGLPIHQKNEVNSDWLTILILIITILFASVKVSKSKYLKNVFHSLVNYSASLRMFREKNYNLLHGAYRLNLIFYLVFPLFLFQLMNYFQLDYFEKTVSFYFTVIFVLNGYFLIYFLSLENVGKYYVLMLKN